MIPCNPTFFINQAYGDKWNIPIESGFGWKNMNMKYYYNYSNKDWPNVRKLYDEFGRLNVNKTLIELNERVQYGKPVVNEVKDSDSDP